MKSANLKYTFLITGAIIIASVSYFIALNDYKKQTHISNLTSEVSPNLLVKKTPASSQNIEEIINTEELSMSSMDYSNLDLNLSEIEPSAGSSEENIVTEEVSAIQNEIDKTIKHDTPKYKTNASPVPLQAGKAYIALIIDDLGQNDALSRKTIQQLPPEITFAFLPYGKNSLQLAKDAHLLDHEIMIHLPMEAMPDAEGHYPNPGKNHLSTDLTSEEIITNIAKNLKGFKKISVGVNNHMGSKFTADLEKIQIVLSEVAKEKLFFLDSLTTNKSQVKNAFKVLQESSQISKEELPLISRDIFIDHIQEVDKIRIQLDKLANKALKKGYAIGIGHPHIETLEALEIWLEEISQRDDIQLIPITTTLKWQ